MSVNDSLIVIVLAQAVLYGTPLLYAALGELLAERSGVLNLGVEGMMLFGAAVGFWITQRVDGSSAFVLFAAILVSALAGAAMAAIHAFLVITLRANQIVSGLALTIFAGGLGLSAYFGTEIGISPETPVTHQFGSLDVLGLGDVAVVGPILFDQSAVVYASWASDCDSSRSTSRSTRFGLNVRAVGEAPASADAMGINVTRYRYVHVIVGGAFAGVAGARATASPCHRAGVRATRSSAEPAGSRSRSSSSRSGAPSSVSSARTCSGDCPRCRSRCRHATSR